MNIWENDVKDAILTIELLEVGIKTKTAELLENLKNDMTIEKVNDIANQIQLFAKVMSKAENSLKFYENQLDQAEERKSVDSKNVGGNE